MQKGLGKSGMAEQCAALLQGPTNYTAGTEGFVRTIYHLFKHSNAAGEKNCQAASFAAY